MRLEKGLVEHLSRKIVDQLIESGDIELEGSREHLYNIVASVFVEDMAVEDKLNEEVKEMLSTHSTELDRDEISYGRMFQMVKRKLVKERGLIL